MRQSVYFGFLSAVPRILSTIRPRSITTMHQLLHTLVY